MLSMPIRIRQARSAARLSQAQLASKLGVRRSAVAQWESAQGTSPNTEHLSQLALTTGARFEWLATGRGSRTLEACDAEPALIVHDFALDEMESRMLESFRRLPPRQRAVACSILDVLLR